MNTMRILGKLTVVRFKKFRYLLSNIFQVSNCSRSLPNEAFGLNLSIFLSITSKTFADSNLLSPTFFENL